MADISPMILASALANLSLTRPTSGGDRSSIMAKADSNRERQLARCWSVRSMEASRSSLLICCLRRRGSWRWSGAEDDPEDWVELALWSEAMGAPQNASSWRRGRWHDDVMASSVDLLLFSMTSNLRKGRKYTKDEEGLRRRGLFFDSQP